MHHAIDTSKRVCERERLRLNTHIKWAFADICNRMERGYQFDALILMIGFVYLLLRDLRNPFAYYLIGRYGMAKDQRRQNQRLCHSIVPFNISSRIGLRIALRLSFGKHIGIVASVSHSSQDIIGGTVENATDRTHSGTCQSLPNGTKHRSTSHDR